jgi:hypothetical protein
MTHLTIHIPDDLASRIKGIASEEHKTVQEWAVERLNSILQTNGERRPGSAQAILSVLQEPPRLSSADTDELDAAIAAGRLPVEERDVFER